MQESAKTLSNEDASYLDFNRAGMGMLKIYTRDELEHPTDTVLAAMELQKLLYHMTISKADFTRGSLRLKMDIMLLEDENVAVEKVSFKNMSSFEDMESCIISEVKRQAEVLKQGGKVAKETRKFNAITKQSKELTGHGGAVDFRYLADPDMPAVKINPTRISKASDFI